LVVAVLALAVPIKGYCTDWLMLDATEPVKAPPVAGSLSFSLQYQASNDTPLLAGPWRGQPDQFNRFAPRYANGRVLQVPNAAIGIHGRLWEGAVAPFEVKLRYDVLNRGTDDRNTDIRFQALTIGGVYRFTPTTQVIVDYQFRRYDAPFLPRSSPTNLLLDGVDNRFGVRLTQQWNF
jgi:hypothetical protein